MLLAQGSHGHWAGCWTIDQAWTRCGAPQPGNFFVAKVHKNTTFYATLPELVYSPFVPHFSALDIKLLFDILYPICAVHFQYHRRRLLIGIVRSPLAPFAREGFFARLQIRHRMFVVPVMVRQRW